MLMKAGFKRALPFFEMIAPSPKFPKIIKVYKSINKVVKTTKLVYSIASSEKPAENVCKAISVAFVASWTKKILKAPFTNLCNEAIECDWDKTRKNGLGGRAWFKKTGRTVLPLTVVFHDADKAGKHVDIHIGRTSIVMRVSGKPVENKLEYHKSGELTQKAKDALMDYIKEEIKDKGKVVHNLDHTLRNAGSQWFKRVGWGGYGDGKTRQVIALDRADIYSVKPGVGGTVLLYSPIFRTDGLVYIHKLYEGDGKKAPILTMGAYKPVHPEFKDRLRLKNVHTMDKFMSLVDRNSITKKYDGASAYFLIGRDGMKLWSPRVSVRTGEQIEYSHKFPELADIDSHQKLSGMAEVLFRRKFDLFDPKSWTRKVLSHSEIGGVLNSNKVRTLSVVPEVRPYRVDSVNGVKCIDGLGFNETRRILGTISDGKFIKLPKIVKSGKIGNGWEGLVGYGLHVASDGYKYKPFGDTNDWTVIRNGLSVSDKGVPSGSLVFKSMDSGKEFHLGPGQIGNHATVLDLNKRGSEIVGMVAKVMSMVGHEGRASKFEGWHLDK